MNDTITLTGLVATTPKHIVTSEQVTVTSFRLAATQRRFDTETQKWVDGDPKCQLAPSIRCPASLWKV